ncbi:MAG: hypothetical protein M1839_004082 [Geoglossum umbratile]|nr:MAG: hypothetical protein M1839_004082 [Geoglossum umbratile]
MKDIKYDVSTQTTASTREVDQSSLQLPTGENPLALLFAYRTDLGKVFAARIIDILLKLDDPRIVVDLTTFMSPEEGEPMAYIQGSFRNFVALSTSGPVYCGASEHLNSWWDAGRGESENTSSASSRGPDVPLGLQNRNIISVAFGDWHMHALTADGNILSVGREPQGTGCLGLGSKCQGGQLRGVRTQGEDSYLIGSAQETGRAVWFESEKLHWLQFMEHGGICPDMEILNRWKDKMRESEEFQELVSDEFEQLGREWHVEWEPKKYGGGEDEPCRRAFFATSVAAGGSHSGALMLVNYRVLEWQRSTHGKSLPVLHCEHDREGEEIRNYTVMLLSKKLGSWSGPESLRCRLPFLFDSGVEPPLPPQEPHQAIHHGNDDALIRAPVHRPGERGHGPVVHPGHPPNAVGWEGSIAEPLRSLSTEGPSWAP